ncbi:MAG: DUF169 domain-containing protein [Bradymonadales bacterium]|nr:DUF169 domain-containing protein [Bradymonadales bacterium]
MAPTQQAMERLVSALRLDTPIIALTDTAPDAVFEPMVRGRGRACCFAYYPRWCRGETLVIERSDAEFSSPDRGCPGMQRAFGLAGAYPSWMAHFLTDGQNGAPQGEGLKASPELAQEFLDRVVSPKPQGDHLLVGPLHLEHWPAVRAITFFADPDRLSALMTLATYWSSDPDEVMAPFSSGCGLMWREMLGAGRDRAILGCTDIAMRKYLPPEIMCLSVSPWRFERMVDYPDDAFLNRSWWRDLLKSREQRKKTGC